jgi:hypothetical protein
VRPSSAGACGAVVRVLETTEDGLPVFSDEPFLVIALTLKNVCEPAVNPLETKAEVAVDLVFETMVFQVVLFLLASIL